MARPSASSTTSVSSVTVILTVEVGMPFLQKRLAVMFHDALNVA